MSILFFRKRMSTAEKLSKYPFEAELREIIQESLASTPPFDPHKDQFHQHLKRVIREKRRNQYR